MRARLEVPERIVFFEGAISIEPGTANQAGACPSELLGLVSGVADVGSIRRALA